MDIFTFLLYVASFVSAVVISCLWFPSVERMIGFCIVQLGLLVAGAGLKLSVYGGCMVDNARLPIKSVSLVAPDGIPVGGQVPCDCSLCRENDFPVIMIRPRPRAWTRPLSNDQLN